VRDFSWSAFFGRMRMLSKYFELEVIESESSTDRLAEQELTFAHG
jgi:hypothetical protein